MKFLLTWASITVVYVVTYLALDRLPDPVLVYVGLILGAGTVSTIVQVLIRAAQNWDGKE